MSVWSVMCEWCVCQCGCDVCVVCMSVWSVMCVVVCMSVWSVMCEWCVCQCGV